MSTMIGGSPHPQLDADLISKAKSEKVAQLEGEVEHWKHMYNGLHMDFDRLAALINDSEARAKELAGRYDRLTAAYDGLQDEVIFLRRENARLRLKISATTSQAIEEG